MMLGTGLSLVHGGTVGGVADAIDGGGGASAASLYWFLPVWNVS